MFKNVLKIAAITLLVVGFCPLRVQAGPLSGLLAYAATKTLGWGVGAGAVVTAGAFGGASLAGATATIVSATGLVTPTEVKTALVGGAISGASTTAGTLALGTLTGATTGASLFGALLSGVTAYGTVIEVTATTIGVVVGGIPFLP